MKKWEVEKLFPVFEEDLFGVAETSFWMTDYEKWSNGNIIAFFLNILTTISDEMKKVITKLKSPTFIKKLTY